MRFVSIYDSMLNQPNIYFKLPLINTKNELQSTGSFWWLLYLEKTGTDLGCSKQNCYSGFNIN